MYRLLAQSSKNPTKTCKSGGGDLRLSFVSVYLHANLPSRLITLYQLIHDALHGKSGQETTLKLQYIRTEKEGVLGWVRTFSLSQGRLAYLHLDNPTF